MPEKDPWLRDIIASMADDVREIRKSQERAAVENAERLAKIDSRFEAVEVRLDDVDHRISAVKHEAKQEARRWGAAGGASTALVALCGMAAKLLFGK